jgi:diphthamide biosynthesis protein 3
MTAAYDTLDLLDMDYEPQEQTFSAPCPCGDKFFITLDELADNEDVARCPSCSLILKVQDGSNVVVQKLAAAAAAEGEGAAE